VFNLCDVFQKCNRALKRDLPILHLLLLLAVAATTGTAAANNLHTQLNVILCSKLIFVWLVP